MVFALVGFGFRPGLVDCAIRVLGRSVDSVKLERLRGRGVDNIVFRCQPSLIEMCKALPGPLTPPKSWEVSKKRNSNWVQAVPYSMVSSCSNLAKRDVSMMM